MKCAHIIDISAVFFRYYFSPSPEIFNEDDHEVSALISSVRWLCDERFFLSQITVLAFDESLGTGFRHELDEDYKANRALPTDDIIYQLACLQQIAQMMGFAVLKSSIYEADDLIASAINNLPDYQATIHSRDKDLRQLLAQNCVMQDVQTNKIWDVAGLYSEIQLTPQQIPDYLALMGDASDNIIGVPGVGDKTARTLLGKFETWPGILLAIESNEELGVRGSQRIAGLVDEYQDLVTHNLALTELVNDVEVQDEINAIEPFTSEQYLALNLFCQEVGIAQKLNKPLLKIKEYLS